jgi:hypothetical protein
MEQILRAIRWKSRGINRKRLYDQYGIKRNKVTRYRSRANGLVEAFMKNTTRALKVKTIEQDHMDTSFNGEFD